MLLHLLVALATIMVTARLVGLAFKQIGQPAVIGEVVGGLLLGPSFLGHFWPNAAQFVLPPSVAPVIGVIAQAAVILYMFLIGLELDLRVLRSRIPMISLIAGASIAVPFALGFTLGSMLAVSPPFMGIALSITAFPVLARILNDRGLQRTDLGVLALTCAAINDAVVWTVLALVAGVGNHSIFIAFFLGALIPHGRLMSAAVNERISGVVRIALLPSFFALTGMRTEIGLLQTMNDWLLCGAITAVAVAGKFGGTSIAARVSGLSWRDSATLGILMNTRGLVELIVLNLGLDLGLLSPRLFTMLVVMALVTTLMTSPLLTVVRHDRSARSFGTEVRHDRSD